MVPEDPVEKMTPRTGRRGVTQRGCSGCHRAISRVWRFLLKMSPYANKLSPVTAEVLEVFTALNRHGGFQVWGIQAVMISADNDAEWVVYV